MKLIRVGKEEEGGWNEFRVYTLKRFSRIGNGAITHHAPAQ